MTNVTTWFAKRGVTCDATAVFHELLDDAFGT